MVAAVDVVPFDNVDDAVEVCGDDMGMFVDDATVLFGTAEEDAVVGGLEVVEPTVVVGPHIPQYLEQYWFARIAFWHI